MLQLEDLLRRSVIKARTTPSAWWPRRSACRQGRHLATRSTPIGVLLFVGPSGVGKTETGARAGRPPLRRRALMVTINMSEFQEKHTVSRLIGSPPGYVGYGEGGVLTEAVRQRPYSVVLLDEGRVVDEKADLEVMNLF
jgi:type VI secretion system protein VasG